MVCRVLGLVCLALICHASLAFGDEPNSGQSLHDKWVGRLTENLSEVKPEDRFPARGFAAYALAKSGETERAIALAESIRPPNRAMQIFVGIVGTLSAEDHVDEALELTKTLPENRRQRAYSLVVVRQAQRGDLQNARDLLRLITHQSARDNALEWIARAEAIRGQFAQGRKTTGRIRDKVIQRAVIQFINRREKDPLPVPKLRSSFLRDNFRLFFQFTGRPDQRDALLALVAAQNKDDENLETRLNAALDGLEKRLAPERQATRALLAVALLEAGRQSDAQEMILKARRPDGQWKLGSSIFGSPILLYLLIHLEMTDELESFMEASTPTEDGISQIAYHNHLHDIGMIFTELGRLKDAERYYIQLKTPLDRLHFSSGVLQGLATAQSGE